MIHYDSLEKAWGQLEKALSFASSHGCDADLFEQFRNSVIRTLAATTASDQEVDGMPYNEVNRLGAGWGFLDQPEPWFDFRTARNKTSHGYEESFAQEGYLSAQRFLPAGQELLRRLRAHR